MTFHLPRQALVRDQRPALEAADALNHNEYQMFPHLRVRLLIEVRPRESLALYSWRFCPKPPNSTAQLLPESIQKSEPVDRHTLALWRQHLQGETDAAFLYRELAASATAEEQQLYLELADVEDRHTSLWADVFAEYGIAISAQRPSTRVRLFLLFGRLFGDRVLHSLLLREEGLEVKSGCSLVFTLPFSGLLWAWSAGDTSSRKHPIALIAPGLVG